MPPTDLILRDDNLDTVGIFCSRNRVLENADGADDLSIFNDANFPTLVVIAKVARIANDVFGLHGFGSATHADKLTIRAGDDLIDWFVEHVSAAVNGGEARKCLR